MSGFMDMTPENDSISKVVDWFVGASQMKAFGAFRIKTAYSGTPFFTYKTALKKTTY